MVTKLINFTWSFPRSLGSYIGNGDVYTSQTVSLLWPPEHQTCLKKTKNQQIYRTTGFSSAKKIIGTIYIKLATNGFQN